MTETLEYATPVKPKKSAGWVGVHIARILIGLLFAFAGLNGFFNFATPPPDQLPPFAKAMMDMHYMMPLVAGTQLLVAVLFLINRFVPFAVVVMTPLVVNIVLIHIVLERSGLPIALILLVLWALMVWGYRKAYAPMFVAKMRPFA